VRAFQRRRGENEFKKRIRDLAQNSGVEVFAETRSARPRRMRPKSVQDRAHESNVNGVYFMIHASPPHADVFIGEALRGEGFDEKQLAQLLELVERAVSPERIRPGACWKGVRFVARSTPPRKAPCPRIRLPSRETVAK